MTLDLKEFSAEALAWIEKNRPAGMEAEVYVDRDEERSAELSRGGELDSISQASGEGVGLRLLHHGRMGFAASGGLSLDIVKDLYAKVIAQLPSLEEDKNKGFASPLAVKTDPELSATLWDESLFTRHWDEILPRLEAMAPQARAQDKRIESIVRIGYTESRGEVLVCNTLGVNSWERGGSASISLSALGKQGDETQVGSDFQSARRVKDLDFDRVARVAGERTKVLLGGKKLPGAKRAIVFDPWIAGEILELVAGLLCADQVQRGKSLLAGKLGKKVASSLVSFDDDPRRPYGLSSSLFDDEGLTTAAKTMIEGGVLKEYFYDTYTARKDDRATNASAGRGSYKGLPGPASSNFYLRPGKQSREAILEDTKDGILVLDIMGMHMADPISGEFSVGISGLAIKNGKLSSAVKGAMVSGNLLDLLGRIDAVGSDLTFYGAIGSPTFRVAGLHVA